MKVNGHLESYPIFDELPEANRQSTTAITMGESDELQQGQVQEQPTEATASKPIQQVSARPFHFYYNVNTLATSVCPPPITKVPAIQTTVFESSLRWVFSAG